MGRPSPGTPILDDKLILPLRFLIDRNYLADGQSIGGTIQWKQNGQLVAAMHLAVLIEGNAGTLSVTHRTTTGGGGVQFIELTAQHSNLGPDRGKVWYFVCPATGSRCRVLYFSRGYFYSRKAYPDAIYRSQAEPKSPWRGCPAPPKWPEGKRIFYRGVYTKAYRRHLKALSERSRSFMRLAETMG